MEPAKTECVVPQIHWYDEHGAAAHVWPSTVTDNPAGHVVTVTPCTLLWPTVSVAVLLSLIAPVPVAVTVKL
jgi:hypothetical protein